MLILLRMWNYKTERQQRQQMLHTCIHAGARMIIIMCLYCLMCLLFNKRLKSLSNLKDSDLDSVKTVSWAGGYLINGFGR